MRIWRLEYTVDGLTPAVRICAEKAGSLPWSRPSEVQFFGTYPQFQRFFKPVDLDRQPAHLLHQRGLRYRLLLFPPGWRAEHRTGTAFQLLLPFGDPGRVDVVLTCQLSQRLVTAHCLDCHFELEFRCVGVSLAFAHDGISIGMGVGVNLAHLNPLSNFRGPLYNTVVNKQWRDKGFYYINQGVTLLAFSLPVHFQSFAFSPHF